MQRFRAALPILLISASLLAVSGCARRRTRAYTPPPPSRYHHVHRRRSARLNTDEHYIATHRPIYTEVGIASWYGPGYNHHRAADGSIYHENEFSAAHRTLPLGSLVKVTNLRNGRSAILRITDRGPFVPGRIIDLSRGAAKAIGIYYSGLGRVRVSVYWAPEPLFSGGQWAVQVGAFRHKRAARRLERHLERRYRRASVIEFRGPTGNWVRIVPSGGSRQRAIQISRTIHDRRATAFLLRLH